MQDQILSLDKIRYGGAESLYFKYIIERLKQVKIYF